MTQLTLFSSAPESTKNLKIVRRIEECVSFEAAANLVREKRESGEYLDVYLTTRNGKHVVVTEREE